MSNIQNAQKEKKLQKKIKKLSVNNKKLSTMKMPKKSKKTSYTPTYSHYPHFFLKKRREKVVKKRIYVLYINHKVNGKNKKSEIKIEISIVKKINSKQRNVRKKMHYDGIVCKNGIS